MTASCHFLSIEIFIWKYQEELKILISLILLRNILKEGGGWFFRLFTLKSLDGFYSFKLEEIQVNSETI